MAAGELDVWLCGTRIAVIDADRGRPRLTYTEEALNRYPPGTPLLSLSLPVRAERYPQGVVRGFLDGLLLEGDARRRVAREVGVAADDTYGLIRALGRDCAGSVVIQPASEPALPPTTTLGAEPLDDSALAELVANLESVPLGVSGRVRVSLAGVQDKLLLTRLPDGSWGRPVDGTPSTHILKPEIAAYPDTVANEAFCMSPQPSDWRRPGSRRPRSAGGSSSSSSATTVVSTAMAPSTGSTRRTSARRPGRRRPRSTRRTADRPSHGSPESSGRPPVRSLSSVRSGR